MMIKAATAEPSAPVIHAESGETSPTSAGIRPLVRGSKVTHSIKI
jgi:hypothetical protein